MLQLPGIIGFVFAKYPGKRVRPNTRNAGPPGAKGRSVHSAPMPLGLYKRRAAKDPARHRARPEAPECCCFRYCDQLYQQMSQEERLLWRRAIKKPGISPYDLWMSECLTATIMHAPPPDYPSLSGGWSTRKVAPGSVLPVAPCWPVLVNPPPFQHVGVTQQSLPPNPSYRVDVTWAPNILEWPEAQRHVEPASHPYPPSTWSPGMPMHWPLTSRVYTVLGSQERLYWAFLWPRTFPRVFVGLARPLVDWTWDHPNARPWPGEPQPPATFPNPVLPENP